MALEMKKACERCEQPLTEDGEAWICTWECTFCNGCKQNFSGACPNCGGELVRRPRRQVLAD